MKLGKSIFPIISSFSLLPMIGLTSCGNNNFPFDFNPDIRNVNNDNDAYYQNKGGWDMLVTDSDPIVVSKKSGNFDQDDVFKVRANHTLISFKTIEGPAIDCHHIGFFEHPQFNEGKFDLTFSFIVYWNEKDFPQEHIKSEWTMVYDLNFEFGTWDDLDECKMKNNIMTGIIDYTPSKEK